MHQDYYAKPDCFNKLVTTAQESPLLSAVQRESARVCNTIVLVAHKNNC
ncbi:hypothetical protein H0X06_07055 [Candidatus Dependentiae bacterium]|nr:hypothetical protein [Candidatus Dependentiae bacterium]